MENSCHGYIWYVWTAPRRTRGERPQEIMENTKNFKKIRA